MRTATIFLLVAAAYSCNEPNDYDATRIIRNLTEYNLRIYVAGDFGDSLIYNIMPFDSLMIEGICRNDELRYCNIGWDRSRYTEIIFDTLRVLKNDPNICVPSSPQAKCLGIDPRFEQWGWVGENRNGDEAFYIYEIAQEAFNEADLL